MLWGYDVSEAWAAIGEVANAPPGGLVLDMPSGGGIALRGLRPGQQVRYVASDISAVMLTRLRTRARDHTRDPGLRPGRNIGLVQADIAALPFPDRAFDLCLSYNGLHCFPEPAAAIGEYARVLRPGGVLRGTTIVAGTGRRHDAVPWALRRVNAFGPPLRPGELITWLQAAGFCDVLISRSGAVAAFTARRGSGD